MLISTTAVVVRTTVRAVKMDQWVKVLATKVDSLSLGPESPMVEEED